ncbi:NADH dehydrogenase [ubiquinone] 1 beta subcomplex subunit 7 [Schistosoma japonicum]|uniref:NADH dehydrogenase [ubiquinone] 1 beta subcomplex subunit 7 n=1 Tax=Schistosoma japonicum TaxID=6182 RepID=Q5DHM9_SCHJA|nr:SJCHGC05899 protein [Schistosoma japonicum]KAH8852550.1 NADH dehydrogenase [ubiquinone] 1 beta subcomplex subunit 7 [Schistosoma japonicum]KAH8852551.1 NADH dehydrogenase [ubiquinone] 1 beta subcomplex subunit 7 [Schistosoma japonicum]TNN15005.1 NADH dehydrogenase [ubiquinone] 1 beta subcomplex subunit 7 [Schistosoma japonicum]TNN15006.1 NADH dehydrogenase [ubiquinone] 1 beta subcomplex subunit 7 [Schistosoma japonicum]
MGHVLATYKDPNSMPDIFRGPIFNPLDGFPEGRKRRQSILTEDEMIAAGLRSHERDYCAHILIAFKKCQKEYIIPALFCSDIKHQYSDCKRDDFVLRMKEYERERRLMRKREITLNETK